MKAYLHLLSTFLNDGLNTFSNIILDHTNILPVRYMYHTDKKVLVALIKQHMMSTFFASILSLGIMVNITPGYSNTINIKLTAIT